MRSDERACGAGTRGDSTDGVVGDEGWLEVFTSGETALAVVHVSGADYGSLVLDALEFPADEDDRGDVIEVHSGELVYEATGIARS